MSREHDDKVYLDATLRPNRSLSRAGFLFVMSAVALGGFGIGTAFFLAGAWPVAGFCGLEILLVYIAFKVNFREGRRRERLFLNRNGFQIFRISPKGEETVERLEPTWLSVDLVLSRQRQPRLILRSHGKEWEVGRFLAPFEKAEVADALRVALGRYRARA